MKIKLFIASLILVVMMFSIPGCKGHDSDLEIKLAPIHEVKISIAESFPEQIFVHIKGGLDDSCTKFHDLIEERSGTKIKIKITTERPRNAICAQVFSYFEKSINLGSDFTSGQIYTVEVNGITQTFVYP